MSAPLSPVGVFLAAPAEQRARLAVEYLSRSAVLAWSGMDALAAADLDVSVRSVGPEPVDEPAAMAEVAVRHRALIGRVAGFGPAEYAEMVAAMRSVFGELHPDDAVDLAAVDLWEVQDRHTGEPVPADPGTTEQQQANIAQRAGDARVVLRESAASALV